MTRTDTEAEIIAEQYSFKKLPNIDIKEYLKQRQEEFKKQMGGRKVDYEFQELGLELDKWFGKKCWFIFYRPEAELNKVKYALEQCKKYKKTNISYFLKVLRK